MTPPSQFPVFWKISKQNMLNYMQDHKTNLHFSDNELKKKSSLIFKRIWYSNSTTATIIINYNPQSTENNVKLISWS
jgi:hypothetical protein